jgi:NAD(P)-dependent dehydrogenase (short-subunit alcohol dehydrogenase family)
LLTGKKGIVTGGGRGIGRETALAMAGNGADVIACSRNESELEETVRLSVDGGFAGSIEPFVCDIASEDDVKRLATHAGKRFGSLDVLVNNAGMFSSGRMESLETEHMRKAIEVNCVGMFVACREVFPLMKEKGGSIINVSSLSGVRGVEKFPGFGAYIVSKFGVIGLTEALAVEWKDFGIRVNAIAPGAVDTEMLRAAAPDLEPVLSTRQVADTILFLASSASSGVNGSTIEIFSNLLKEPRGQ